MAPCLLLADALATFPIRPIKISPASVLRVQHKIPGKSWSSLEDLVTKNLSLASATVVLVLSLGALAQQNSRSGAVRVQNPDPVTTARKAVMLTGRVGDDGKVLVSEDQDQWGGQ